MAEQRRWEHGRQAFLRGQYAEACRAWNGCDRPEAPAAVAEARLRLALVAKQPREAAAELTLAIRCTPEDPRLHGHLCRALWRSGDVAGARAAARRATALAPADSRYRELDSILSALVGDHPPSGDWRARLLAAAAGPDAQLPLPPEGTPLWAQSLLGTMRALAAEDWTRALGEATRGLGLPGVPPAVIEAFRHYAAAAAGAAGQWNAVLAAHPAGGAFAPSAAALRRAAAAQVLVDAGAGNAEPAAAEMALEVLAAQGGLPGEMRDRAAVAIGLLHAAQENWAAAIRHWSATGLRYDLLQPLALAHERAGHHEAAAALWQRVAAGLRRGGASGWPAVPPQVAAVAAYDHLAATAERRGDVQDAARFAEQAFDLARSPDARRCVDLARLIMEMHPEPSARWEKAAALLQRAVDEDSRDARLWRELAAVRRAQGRLPEALEAGRRAQGLDPRDKRLTAEVVEDFGRSILDALQGADLAEAETLAEDVGHLGGAPQAGTAGSSSDLVAHLARAVLSRLRGDKRPPAMGRWDAVFRKPAGEAAPPSAFALRGLIALLGGYRERAADLFERVRDAECWQRDAPGEDACLAWYLRWIAHAHCWARQIRAGGAPSGECARAWECQAMRKLLADAVLLEPPGASRPTPPPALAGCPQVAGLYSGWLRDIAAAEKMAMRMARRMEREGMHPEDIFGDLDEDGGGCEIE